MSKCFGKEWYRTHYKPIAESNKKRRGEKRQFSESKSKTMTQWWEDEHYRSKLGVERKTRWSNPEYKEKMRRVLYDNPKRKEQHSKDMKAWWSNPENKKRMVEKRKKQVTQDNLKKIGDGMKKRWANPEFHAKMCLVRKTQSRGNQLRHPKGSFYRTMYAGTNGKFWMRSGWEVKFANWLDEGGIRWEYETKRFDLGSGKHYTPDFYLPDQDVYVELKGWMTKENQKKLDYFAKVHPEVKLWVFRQQHLSNILRVA